MKTPSLFEIGKLYVLGWRPSSFNKRGQSLTYSASGWTQTQAQVQNCQSLKTTLKSIRKYKLTNWKYLKIDGTHIYVGKDGRVLNAAFKEIAPVLNDSGRYHVKISAKNKHGDCFYKFYSRYWLVAAAYLGHTKDDGFEIHHRNSKRTDDNVSNLLLVTPEEHRKLHGIVTGPSLPFKHTYPVNTKWRMVVDAFVNELANGHLTKDSKIKTALIPIKNELNKVKKNNDAQIIIDEMFFAMRLVAKLGAEANNEHVNSMNVRSFFGECLKTATDAKYIYCTIQGGDKETIENFIKDELTDPKYKTYGFENKMRKNLLT